MRAEQVVHREVGEQPAAPEHDEVVGGLLHLAHQVAGDQHVAALVGEVAQQFTHPADAFGIQPVDRLVEHQDVGIAEQRRRDTQPLPHAEGEPAHALVGDRSRPTSSMTSSTRVPGRPLLRARASRCA